MELQLREGIKRTFGDKSPEFQTYRQNKLSVSSPSETKKTVSLIKDLIASLEDKKLELQGLKPAATEQPVPSQEPAFPQMTLVPPTTSTAQVSQPSVTSVTHSSPVAVTVEVVSAVKQHEPVPVVASTPAVSTAPLPIAQSTPPPAPSAAPSPQPIQARTPIEPISSLFHTQETKPVPPVPQPTIVPPPAPSSAPVQPPAPPAPPRSTTATQEASAVPVQSAPAMPLHTPAVTPSASAATEGDHLTITKKLCQRFHVVARQLRLRGEHRPTLNVEDESDVQDLLHALLRLQFDDISTDEWTPGYTNGAPRTTFLLNHDRLAVVVKKTRTGLTAKDLTDQVRTDIERYRSRGRCTHFLCFVYDPEGRIGNPRGMERELAATGEQFTVDMVVAPQ
jgi:hypothetical protein